MSYICPQCQSDNIQRLSVIYEGGLSEINTTSSTSGVGGTRNGLGVGVATTKTKGKSQTTASQRAAPPAKLPYLKPLMVVFVLYMIVLMFTTSVWIQGLFTLVWVGGSALYVYFAFQYNKKTWPPLKAAWDNSYMCHRCHNVFVLNPSVAGGRQ
jgi:hypothetical protein